MDNKKEVESKEKQLKLLQQTLQNMQQQLIEMKRKQSEEESKMAEYENLIKKIENKQRPENFEKNNESEPIEKTAVQVLNECDAKLVGLISTFLNVHPFGANLDYIWSYVNKLETNLRPSDVELLMSKFPSVFKQELVGIGANIERRWIFNAFNHSKDI